MKKTALIALACSILLAGCQSTTNSTQVTTRTITLAEAATRNAPALQGEMTALINAQRAANGRSALAEDPALSRAAQAFAADMEAFDYFSHTGRNGSSFMDRARAVGYGCVAAENIARGQRSEAAVMEAWMNSSGHRRNILLRDARDYGIGLSGDTWVMLLGRGC